MEYMLDSTEKYIFFNPEIPGFGLCQSRDSGLRKTSGIPWFRDYNPYLHGVEHWAWLLPWLRWQCHSQEFLTGC